MEETLAQGSSPNAEYPVVMMSCTEGTNKDQFLEEIQRLASNIMGKKNVRLTFPYYEHDRVQGWL